MFLAMFMLLNHPVCCAWVLFAFFRVCSRDPIMCLGSTHILQGLFKGSLLCLCSFSHPKQLHYLGQLGYIDQWIILFYTEKCKPLIYIGSMSK